MLVPEVVDLGVSVMVRCCGCDTWRGQVKESVWMNINHMTGILLIDHRSYIEIDVDGLVADWNVLFI